MRSVFVRPVGRLGLGAYSICCVLLASLLVFGGPKAASAENIFSVIFSSSKKAHEAKKKRIRARKLREKRRKYREAKRRRRAAQRRAYRKAKYKKRYKKKRRLTSKRRTKKVVAAAWPKAPENGPVQVVVSLPNQRMTVLKNGQPVITSKVSTGRSGYDTPSGIFSILEKRRRHFSNIYDSAPMPHMQRLTWSGIALHGSGHVPAYPASHGCVRLPHGFASQLFRFTKRGAHVVLTHGDGLPQAIDHPNLLQPRWPEPVAETVRVEPSALEGLRGGDDLKDSGNDSRDTDLNGLRTASLDVDSDSMRDVEALVVPARPATPPPVVRTSKAPLRILITRRTGRDRIMDTQRLLNELGYEAGTVDGIIGRNTRDAIRAFQESLGLEQTGTMNEAFEYALHRASGRGDVATGHIYVRQNFRELFDQPITIEKPEQPLGTHLFTALHFDKAAGTASWTAMTLPGTGTAPDAAIPAQPAVPELAGGPQARLHHPPAGPEAATAASALARIVWPDDLRHRLSHLLTPGSSISIADEGMSHETGRGTDFIVLTK